MNVRMLRALCLAAAVSGGGLLGGCGEGGPGDGKRTYATLGTGGVTGVYYTAGQAIARLVNRDAEGSRLNLSAQSTGGSVFNINAVLAGELQFGFCQSDRQYQAVHGLAEWSEKGPREKLRAICSLHPEAVYLVAAEDAGIRTLADLKGKTVNIGNPGSGQRGNALDILRAAGIDPRADLRAEAVKADEGSQMLQDGRIDAFFFTVGHGAGQIREATAGLRRKVRFVPITGMDRLIKDSPYYGETKIPIALYPRATNEEDVPTIGVMTTLVTGADVPEEMVYALTRVIFTRLDELRQIPALADLKPEAMVREGLSAPIHPGARKYYIEAGLAD